MATRRSPYQGAAQGGQERGNVAGAMTMPPMPGLGGPPPQPQGPMPQGPPTSGPILPGMPDVQAGGPSSPFNIDEMLKTNEPKMSMGAPGAGGGAPPPGMPESPVRRTLQPWGDTGASSAYGGPSQPHTQPAGRQSMMPGEGGGNGGGEMGAQPGQQPGAQGQGPSMGDAGGGLAPMVMLRLLKALGRI